MCDMMFKYHFVVIVEVNDENEKQNKTKNENNAFDTNNFIKNAEYGVETRDIVKALGSL